MRTTRALFTFQEGSGEGDVFQSKKLIWTIFKWLSRPHVFDERTKMVQGDDSSCEHEDQSSNPRNYIMLNGYVGLIHSRHPGRPRQRIPRARRWAIWVIVSCRLGGKILPQWARRESNGGWFPIVIPGLHLRVHRCARTLSHTWKYEKKESRRGRIPCARERGKGKRPRRELLSERESHCPTWSARSDPNPLCAPGFGGRVSDAMAGEASVLSKTDSLSICLAVLTEAGTRDVSFIYSLEWHD